MGAKIYSQCPNCSSSDLRLKHSGVIAHDDTGEFDIFECKNCQLQFVAQILTPEEIEEYYCKIKKLNDHIYLDENVKYLNYYYNELKKRIERNLASKGNILDIGCSSGYFLDVMDGWNRYGVEISTQYASVAKEKYGDNIFVGSVDDYEIKENFFDVITIQDALDHMIDPAYVVQKCYKMLKVGGVLIIKVHNTDCLYAKITGRNFYAFIPPEHLFYFNQKSIKHLMENSGFKTNSFEFIPHLFQLKTVFLRLSKDCTKSFWYKLYKAFNDTRIGNVSFKKDLHDIVTAFAVKTSDNGRD